MNIGGIANLTVLDGSSGPRGFDTGPGNCLLDAWTERHLGRRYDRDGHWTTTGHVNEALLASLRADPWFAQPPPKSTGRDYFNLSWLRDGERAAIVDAAEPRHVQATLATLTAQTIADAVRAALPATASLLVCGGGAHNPALMRALADALPGKAVAATDAHGLPAAAVEAVAFAWLAKLRIVGEAAPLPALTGATRPLVLGALHAPDGVRGA